MAYLHIYKNDVLTEEMELHEDLYIIFRREQQILFWKYASQFVKPDKQKSGEIHLWFQVIPFTSIHLAFVRPDWRMYMNDMLVPPSFYKEIDITNKKVELMFLNYTFVLF